MQKYCMKLKNRLPKVKNGEAPELQLGNEAMQQLMVKRRLKAVW